MLASSEAALAEEINESTEAFEIRPEVTIVFAEVTLANDDVITDVVDAALVVVAVVVVLVVVVVVVVHVVVLVVDNMFCTSDLIITNLTGHKRQNPFSDPSWLRVGKL